MSASGTPASDATFKGRGSADAGSSPNALLIPPSASSTDKVPGVSPVPTAPAAEHVNLDNSKAKKDNPPYEIPSDDMSLFVFHPKNLLRVWLHNLLKHPRFVLADKVLTFMVCFIFAAFPTHWTAAPSMLNVYVDGVYPIPDFLNEDSQTSSYGSNSDNYVNIDANIAQWQFYNNIKFKILIALFSLITLKACATIIVRGLIFHKHAYLRRNHYHKLDVISIGSFWTAVAFWIKGVEVLPIFLAFASIYTAHSLSIIEATKKFMHMLKKATPLLLNVAFFLFFFLALFAIIGQRAFAGSMERQCVVDVTSDYTGSYQDNTVGPAWPYLGCGQYIDPFTNQTVGALISPQYPYQSTSINNITGDTLYHTIPKGLTCPPSQLCEPVLSWYNGFRSFDDFGSALVIGIDTVSTSAWSQTMYTLKQSEYPTLVPFYFVLHIVFIAFILSRLFVAVLAEIFSEADLFNSAEVSKRVAHLVAETDDGAWIMDEQNHLNLSDTQKMARRVFRSWQYQMTLALIASANIVCQAAKTAGDSSAKRSMLDNAELGFTLFFLAEVIVKLLVLKRNTLDLFLAVITSIIQIPQIKAWSGYQSFTIFQLMRFYRVLFAFPFLRDLVVRLTRSAVALTYVTMFYFIWCFVASVFAMHYFTGQLTLAEELNVNGNNGFNGNYWQNNYNPMYPPRQNFETFVQSFYVIFRITTGDNWENVWYDSMQSQWNITNNDYPGYSTVSLLVAVLFFGWWWTWSKLVLYNLIVAALLDGFDMDDREKLQKQLKNYMKKAEKKLTGNEKLTMHKKFSRMFQFRFWKKGDVVKVNIPEAMAAGLSKMQLESLVNTVNVEETRNAANKAAVADANANADVVAKRKATIAEDGFSTVAIEFFTESVGYVRAKIMTTVSGRVAASNIANAGTELNSIDSSKVPEDQRVEEHEDKSFKKLVSYRALASEKVRIYPVDEENVEKVKEMYFLDHSLLKHENKVEEVQSYFATELGALETFIKKSRVTWGGDFELDDEVGNDLEKEEEIAPYDLSFGFMTKKNPLRRLCRYIVGADQRDKRAKQKGYDEMISVHNTGERRVTKPLYDYIMVVIIIIATGFLASETPNNLQVPDTSTNPSRIFYRDADYVFFGIFVADIVMRTISDGLFLTPNAYLVQGWNWFDVVLLALLGVDVFHFRALTSSGGLPRAFRALRGLRPLRLINQFDGIRSIFTTLIMSFVALGQAVLFSLAVMLPFAIWAVNQFNGLLGSCNDTNIIYIDDCIGEFENTPFLPPLNYTFVSPRMWANPYYYDFDDIAHSMQALFEDISTENWTIQFYSTRDAYLSGVQPLKDSNLYAGGFFFIPYMLIAAFMLNELFAAVIIDEFRKRMNMSLYTSDQRRWRELSRQLEELHPSTMPTAPNVDKYPWRHWVHTIVMDKRGWFASFITSVMVAHLVLFMTTFNEEFVLSSGSLILLRAQYVISLGFMVLYLLEVVLRLFALGPGYFFMSLWNIYDLIVVGAAFVFGIIAVAQVFTMQFINYYVDQVSKVLVLFILLRLVHKLDKLQTLFKTLLASFTDILNIAMYCVLVLVSFAIVCTQVFGLSRILYTATTSANFQTFFNSIEMLFRMSTGETWNYIMHDYATDDPHYCVITDDEYTTDCGSPAWAYVIFNIWYPFSAMVSLEMFVAVILDKFSYWSQSDSQSSRIDRGVIRDFKDAWRNYDKQIKGAISVHDIPRFLGSLSKRKGAGKTPFFTRIYEKGPFEKVLRDPVYHVLAMSYYQPKQLVRRSDSDKTIKRSRRARSLPAHRLEKAERNWSLFRGLLLVRIVLESELNFYAKSDADKSLTRAKYQAAIKEATAKKLSKQLSTAMAGYYDKTELRKRREDYNSVYLEMVIKSSKVTQELSFPSALQVLAHRIIEGNAHLTFREREERRLIRERVSEYLAMEHATGFLYNLIMKTRMRKYMGVHIHINGDARAAGVEVGLDEDYIKLDESSESLNSANNGAPAPPALSGSPAAPRRTTLTNFIRSPFGARLSSGLATGGGNNGEDLRKDALKAVSQTASSPFSAQIASFASISK